jgi:hypothetical protein
MRFWCACAALVLSLPINAAAQTLGVPKLSTPGGMLLGDRYTFTWTRVPGATYYQLWVTDHGGHVRNQWFTAAETRCAATEAICSVTVVWQFQTGSANWWVRAWAPSVYGAWSLAQTFWVGGRLGSGTLASSITTLGNFAMGKTTNDATNYGRHVAVGAYAMYEFVAGGAVQELANTAVGADSLTSLTSGSNLSSSYNTAIGQFALGQLAAGSFNTAIGEGSGSSLISGHNNLYIHSRVPPANENDTIRIGNTMGWNGMGPHARTFLAGVSGVTSASGVGVFINSDGQLGTLTSSQRFKTNIRDVGSSDRLLRLRPVAFEYNPEVDPTALPQYGLIAEEVEKVFPELVVRDSKGTPETVRYHLLVPLLLHELQRQQEQLKELEARVDSLLADRKDD